MTTKEQELLKGFLSKTLNMDAEAMSGLFNEDGELISMETAINLDAQRMSKQKDERDAQFNRGIKEGAEKIEKAVKKRFGIESEQIGLELIIEAFDAEIAKVSSKKDENIEKHPDFIKQKSNFEKLLREKDAEHQQAIANLQSDFKKVKVLDRIKEMAALKLDAMRPILPEDPIKAKMWRDTFLREVGQGNYSINDDGSVMVLDKEGKSLTDQHGYNVIFDNHVEGIANSYFEFHKAKPRGSTGGENEGGGEEVITFKDEADFIERVKNAKTPEESAKLYESYKKQNK